MSARYLQVASWNIEHFGKDDNNDENQYAIAEHVELAGVDILALQEIYVTNIDDFRNGSEGRNEHLDGTLKLLLEHTGQEWKYELFRNRTESDTSQLCGILWNASRVEHKRTIRLSVPKFVDGGDMGKLWIWDRVPHAVHFSAGDQKIDLAIISIHMKSNVGTPIVVRRKRLEEAKSLIAELATVEAKLDGEKDIVILGDTNCKDGREEALDAFAAAGFEDLNSDDVTTFYRGKDAPFDRIFVPHRESRRAFRYSRQYVLRSTDSHSHDHYLSDHFIIKTSVKILKDDGR